MNCPTCQTENPPGSKFCNECGARLIAKCPTCGQDNAPGSKFCNECGTRLTGDGGRKTDNLSPLPPPPPSPSINQLINQSTDHQAPISNLQSLIPTDFAAKLETARTQKTMVGERRIVTLLFCDVKGSTAAAGQLDPEDWAQIMNGVFEYMIRPVYKYEGTVARLMGDAILAFFGAPVTHEDDPQRAILAGLEIIEGFVPYREKIQADWGLEIDVRVGINTGLVMVGAVGSDLQMEYTALGDAINLAARMEQTATPGTIQVSEDTYKLVAPVFEWEDLGTVEVKGKSEPIHTYRPIHTKSAPGRLRGIEGLDAPMVGRSTELDKLHSALQRLDQGVGSIIFVIGEAGLGKSRLIRELKIENRESRIENPDLRFSILNSRFQWHETTSFSYEVSQPYAIFQRLLRRVCGVDEGDSPAEMWEKFMPILNLIPADVPDQGGVFETLFAFHGQSSTPVPEGEAFKRQLFDLMERIWRSWTYEAPRVLIFDDLHWTDPASVELLTYLFKLTDTCPVVIVCASRPDHETPGWRAKETAVKEYPHRYQEINLHPLSATDTNALVDTLLTISDLPAKLRARILEKTDGNPFFIEEVVRTMIDNGLVVRETNTGGGAATVVHWRAVQNIEDVEIPGNLQSLLVARIDKLEEGARRTLQLASVIGRSFYFRVLASINQAIVIVQDELDRQLLTLQRAELIREAARVPELEYIFKHVLTQEAAYSTILLRQRREFHRQVGEAIENLFPDRLEEFASLLGHHFGEANDPRAGRYEVLAGDAAFRLYAIPEAISHYARALEKVKHEKLGSAQVTSNEVTHLFIRLGRCYELQSNYAEALRVYEELTQMAKKFGDDAMELEAVIAQGKVYAVPNNFQNGEKAQVFSERALFLARSLKDRRAEARIQWNFQLMKMYAGKMDEGIPYGERAIELARELGMQDIEAHALQDLSLAYMAVGELARSKRSLEDAAPIWRTLGNLPMAVENFANRAYERIMAGDFEKAVDLSDQGLRLAERIQNQWGQVNSQVFIAQVYLAWGDIDKVNEIHTYFIPLARSFGHPGSALAFIQQAWLYANIGSFEKAKEAADQAVKDAVSFAPFYAYALALRAWYYMRDGQFLEAEQLLGRSSEIVGKNTTLIEIDIIFGYARIELLLAQGDFEKALNDVTSLVDFLTRAGVRYFLSETLFLKAKIQKIYGQMDAAYETLLVAWEVAQNINFRTQLLQISAALANISDQREDKAQAQQFRDEVKPAIQFILEHMSDPQLTESFRKYVLEEGLGSEQGLNKY